MRSKPINPRPDLPCLNTIYVGAMGSGKSQALKANQAIPRVGARVVGMDHAGDHAGIHFDKKGPFLRALRAAERRGGAFRLFYGGDMDEDTAEWFFDVLWANGDGTKKTYVIIEELAAFCDSAGKAAPNAAIFMNQSRKYNFEFHGTTQRPEEVSKTYYNGCPIKYIGRQNTEAMIRKMSMQAAVAPEQLRALQNLQFYRADGTGPGQLVNIKYQPTGRVIWK